MCGATLLLFFIYCLRSDDKRFRSDSIGYRVIMDPQIAVHKYFVSIGVVVAWASVYWPHGP